VPQCNVMAWDCFMTVDLAFVCNLWTRGAPQKTGTFKEKLFHTTSDIIFVINFNFYSLQWCRFCAFVLRERIFCTDFNGVICQFWIMLSTHCTVYILEPWKLPFLPQITLKYCYKCNNASLTANQIKCAGKQCKM